MMPMLLSSIKVRTNKFNTGVKDIFYNKLIKILKIHFVTNKLIVNKISFLFIIYVYVFKCLKKI